MEMSNTSLANTKLYYICVTLPKLIDGINLFKMADQIGHIFTDLGDTVDMVYNFKITGEAKLIFIVGVPHVGVIEHASATLHQLGPLQIECQPVISYDSFARNLRVPSSLAKPSSERLAKENLYWLEFNVDYHGKSTEKLIKIWKKEAEAVFTAKHKAGASLELFKCVGQRKVHCFINSPTPEYLDALTLQLPLMLENGANVQLLCRSLQFLEDYIAFMAAATPT